MPEGRRAGQQGQRTEVLFPNFQRELPGDQDKAHQLLCPTAGLLPSHHCNIPTHGCSRTLLPGPPPKPCLLTHILQPTPTHTHTPGTKAPVEGSYVSSRGKSIHSGWPNSLPMKLRYDSPGGGGSNRGRAEQQGQSRAGKNSTHTSCRHGCSVHAEALGATIRAAPGCNAPGNKQGLLRGSRTDARSNTLNHISFNSSRSSTPPRN